MSAPIVPALIDAIIRHWDELNALRYREERHRRLEQLAGKVSFASFRRAWPLAKELRQKQERSRLLRGPLPPDLPPAFFDLPRARLMEQMLLLELATNDEPPGPRLDKLNRQIAAIRLALSH